MLKLATPIHFGVALSGKNFLSGKTSEGGKELLEKVLKLVLLDEKPLFGDQTAKSWYEIRKTGF